MIRRWANECLRQGRREQNLKKAHRAHSETQSDNSQQKAEILNLKKLTGFPDEEETTGPPIQKQLADIVEKRWGKTYAW